MNCSDGTVSNRASHSITWGAEVIIPKSSSAREDCGARIHLSILSSQISWTPLKFGCFSFIKHEVFGCIKHEVSVIGCQTPGLLRLHVAPDPLSEHAAWRTSLPPAWCCRRDRRSPPGPGPGGVHGQKKLFLESSSAPTVILEVYDCHISREGPLSTEKQRNLQCGIRLRQESERVLLSG